MKIKHVITTLALAGMLGAGAFAGIKASKAAKQVDAATATTVYYAISDADVGSKTVKLNVNLATSGDDWAQYAMTKTANTYDSKSIYSCSFTDKNDGVSTMQFQLYDGDKWDSQVVPISSWTAASTYNGKLWVKGAAEWKELKSDSELATDWAQAFLDETSPVCSVGGDTADHGTALAAIWHDGTNHGEMPFWGLSGSMNGWSDNMLRRTVADNNLFKVFDIQLTGGTEYQFKVRKDQKWDESYPAQNQKFTPAETGYYTFTFNQYTHAITVSEKQAAQIGNDLIGNEYEELPTGAKNLIKAGVANATITEALERYTHIVTRYNSLYDFIGGIRPSSTRAMANNMNANYIPVVVIVVSSIALVTVLGAGLMIKRRKEDR